MAIKATKSSSGSSGLAFLAGLLCGLAAAFAVALYVNKAPMPYLHSGTSSSGGKAEAAAPDDAIAKVLRERGESAPVAATKAPAAAETQTASLPPEPPSVTRRTLFYVQAGAFSSQDAAKQQVARLALWNIEGKITQRKEAKGTKFRVRAGPYAARNEAEAVRQQLKESDVESELISALE